MPEARVCLLNFKTLRCKVLLAVNFLYTKVVFAISFLVVLSSEEERSMLTNFVYFPSDDSCALELFSRLFPEALCSPVSRLSLAPRRVFVRIALYFRATKWMFAAELLHSTWNFSPTLHSHAHESLLSSCRLVLSLRKFCEFKCCRALCGVFLKPNGLYVQRLYTHFFERFQILSEEKHLV